jgi:amino-acid N-acetyltransferase
MKTRRARAADAAAIHGLIAHYAAQGLLLPRDLAEIRENFRHFLVLENAGEFAGCVALELYGSNLAEIRSLALAPEVRTQGLGRRLLESAMAEAKRRGIPRVFAVTHMPDFFVRHAFKSHNRRTLQEKIERDCIHCPKAAACQLVAVVAEVLPARAALRVLEPAAAPLPA